MNKVFLILLTISQLIFGQKQQFIDSIRKGDIVIAHDHEFNTAQLDSFAKLNFAGKTIQITCDVIDWFDGNQQLNVDSIYNRFSLVSPNRNFKGLFNKKMDLLEARQSIGKLKIITDADQLTKDSIPKVVIAIEGAGALMGDLTNIEKFYHRGLRQLQLCRIGVAPAGYNAININGVTAFGNEVIKRCNSFGIAIDVTHIERAVSGTSDEAWIYDIMAKSSDPIIVSHQHTDNASGAYTKALAKAIVDDGGIVCVQFYKGYLPSNNVAGIVRAIDSLKKNVGIDGIGIGSDYFDNHTPTAGWGIPDLSTINTLIGALYDKGYSISDVKKLMGENLRAYYKKIWKKKCDFNYKDVAGLSFSGTTLTKTASTAWGNCYGSTTCKLRSGDSLTYNVIKDKSVSLGLSYVDTDGSYSSINYSIYSKSDNTINIYHGATLVNTTGRTFDANSKFKMFVDSDTIRFYENDTLMHSSTVSLHDSSYVIDFSMYTIGGAIKDLTVYSGECFKDKDNDAVLDPKDLCDGHDDKIDVNSNGIPDACDINPVPSDYTQVPYSLVNDAYGYSVVSGIINKTASTNWGNAGGSSSVNISDSCYIEYNSIAGAMVGLDVGNSDGGYTSIDHALYTRSDNKLYVYENGVNKTPTGLGSYSVSSVFKIEMIGSSIKYYHNGILIYTGSFTPSSLYMDFSLYNSGSKIKNVYLYCKN
jgi:microsomal dipeptidase-like Zn-dependent dipeptidase/predicted small secreted protein